VLEFLDNLGRVRANDITLQAKDGTVLYRSPQSTYKAGRTAPLWFSRFLAPEVERNVFTLPGGTQLEVQAEVSRAVLDAWDGLLGLVALSVVMLAVVNGLAFWLMGRALAPFPVIAAGLERIESGDLAHRLPPLPGHEAGTMGAAFNRMAQAVQDKVQAERKVRDAESRLENAASSRGSSSRRSRKSGDSSHTSYTTSSGNPSPPSAAWPKPSRRKAARATPPRSEPRS